MYDHKRIEQKWQVKWEQADIYRADFNPQRPKKYILDMFPYPSGAGLHIGHVESYTATDIYSRYYRAHGFNVLHPQGFDAFGLPAENYAIKTGIHPAETTKTAIKNFSKQMKSLGLSYDWSKVINTSDQEYYRWTQWMFLLMYKNGLAYKKKAKVNWCEHCQTVLANEQAEGGVCDRCGYSVIQKDLEQWFFKITDFIEDYQIENQKFKGLLSGLDDIDWPASTKAAQRHWLGRSEGAEVRFVLKFGNLANQKFISVFTTRVDTIFGCTYIVLAPESTLVEDLKKVVANRADIEDYITACRQKTDLQRTDLAKEKTGVKLEGVTAINPFNNQEVAVYIADYVLASYGTGSVMAVPAHDERDFIFAKKYNLPIKISVVPENLSSKNLSITDVAKAYTEDGLVVDSGEFTGLKSAEARRRMIDFLERTNQGSRKINYRMRDWLVSRQRYWGAPIPIIYCDYCGEVPVPEKDLPIVLPTDVDFQPTGESPLKYSHDFNQVVCPKCGRPARRESDTMDTFVCSSWYYLRYIDPHNQDQFAAADKLSYWLPVDVYMGGAEHSVLHLLYARFFTKVLQKYGYVNFNEPFLKLRHQGIILGEDGNKMSKSKGNVVNPDDLVNDFGADALRLYEMFMGPIEDMKPWNSQGISGIRKFLEKIYNIASEFTGQDVKEAVSLLNKTIKKVGEDIEIFHFNTAISSLMILVNNLSDYKVKEGVYPLSGVNFNKFIILLAPFAPHLAEELGEKLGFKESLLKTAWPEYDEILMKEDNICLVVQINGKLRATLELPIGSNEEIAKDAALKNVNVQKWLNGHEIIKTIFIKDKLLSLVIK